MPAPCGRLLSLEANLNPIGDEWLEQEAGPVPAGQETGTVRSGIRLGVESQFQLDVPARLDLIGDDEDVRLDEEEMADEPRQSKILSVGGCRIARPVIEGRRRLNLNDRRPSLPPQQLNPVEPLLALADLSVPVDQKGIVLPGPFGLISVIAHEPLTIAEDDEMVGIGMNVPASRIVREPFGGLMAEERPALEDNQGLGSRPTGSRRDDSHVSKVVEGWQQVGRNGRKHPDRTRAG